MYIPLSENLELRYSRIFHESSLWLRTLVLCIQMQIPDTREMFEDDWNINKN
jgi:hypothetical protein